LLATASELGWLAQAAANRPARAKTWRRDSF
jgi:hypothetical protein